MHAHIHTYIWYMYVYLYIYKIILTHDNILLLFEQLKS